ncbi:hypothetical protein GQ600_14834 [Phytophthora cactorum]|nr:hypothetical protein GQ600_14834 [Phytophthora cactorum]
MALKIRSGESRRTRSSDVQAAECATYSASLCYPGVCEAPEWMDQTVDIFVKRLQSSDPKSATNMWLLQGGPGFASNDCNYERLSSRKIHGPVRSSFVRSGTVRQVRRSRVVLDDSAAKDLVTLISEFSNG